MDELELNYRPARKEDIDRICDLIRDAIAGMEEHNIFQWDALYPTRQDFLDDLNKGELFVGLVKDDIAVVYTLNEVCDAAYQQGKWKYADCEYRILHRFCVDPRYQNRRVAFKTLLHIEKEMRKINVGAIRLDAFSCNPFALALYASIGYEKTGDADWRKGRFYLMEKHLS